MQRIHESSNHAQHFSHQKWHDVDFEKPVNISLRDIPFQIHETR
jgi:hypothetical protein